MNWGDLQALVPLLIVSAFAVAALMATAFCPRHRICNDLAAIGLLLALVSLGPTASAAPRAVTGLLRIDGWALLFMGLVLGGALGTLALRSLRDGPAGGEYSVLLLLSVLGAMTLAAATHFASLLLGLELLTIPLYALIAYGGSGSYKKALEAAMKYLVIAGVASATMVLGMGLVYFQTGSLAFAQSLRDGDLLTSAGFALILVALAFKLALPPVHFWTPDVYQGSPVPVTGFIATVSKGSVLAVLGRLWLAAGPAVPKGPLWFMLASLAVAAMVVGNLLALRQGQIFRLVAYSSVANMGYILVTILAGSSGAGEALVFYLVSYFVMVLGTLGIVAGLAGADGQPLERIEDLRGLVWRRPWQGATLGLLMLGLAGMPLTAGFMAKVFVVLAGARAELWALVVLTVINAAVGLYYYLRVVTLLFDPSARPATEEAPPAAGTVSPGQLVACMLVWAVVVGLGTWPGPLMDFFRRALRY